MSRGYPKEMGFALFEMAMVIAAISVMMTAVLLGGKFILADVKTERTAHELTALARAGAYAGSRSWNVDISGVSPIYSKTVSQNIYGGSNNLTSNEKFVTATSDLSGKEGIANLVPFGQVNGNNISSYSYIFNKRAQGIRYTNKALCRQDCAQKGCNVCVDHCRQLRACDVYNNVCSGGPTC